MKSILVVVLSAISLILVSSDPDELLIGTWQNLDEKQQTWRFNENGRLEVIVDCGEPCEGSDSTYYVDEAGTWKIKNRTVYLVFNENNGKQFKPPQLIELKIHSLNKTNLTLIWQNKGEEHELNFERVR